MISILLVSLTLAADSPELSQEFHRDFRKGEFDFLMTGAGAAEAVALDRGGVRIKLPKGHAAAQPIGFATRMVVHGDFEITVSYEDLKVETPRTGDGTGVTLYVTFKSPRQTAASIGHLLTPKDQYTFITHRAETPPEGKRQHEIETMPAVAGGGKLRLSRTGSTLTYSAAQEGREFQQLHQFEVGPEDVDLIRVAVEPGKARTGVSVLISDLMIRAQEFPGKVKAIDLVRHTLWMAVGGLGALVVGIGAATAWWLSRQRGKPVSPARS
jgi:predicted RNA-binding protein